MFGRKASSIWVDAIENWMTWLTASGKPHSTLRLRKHQIRRLAEAHLNTSPWKVTEDDLVRWLSNPAWGTEARRSARSGIRSFYQWAKAAGRTRVDPSRKLPSIARTPPKPRPAGDDIFTTALAGADTDRLRLMLLFARDAGLRVGEIARIQLTDVDRAARRLMVRGKGRKTRWLPLSDSLAGALFAELDRRATDDHGTGYRFLTGLDVWLFPGTRDNHMTADHVTKLLSRALGTSTTGHQLRHTFGTTAYAATRDLLAVQELLGHSSPETTRTYVEMPADAVLEAVRAASHTMKTSS